MTSLACLLATLLGAVALLHVFWAVSGKRNAGVAVPKKEDGTPLINPGPISCLVVAAGLSAFSYISLAHASIVPSFFLAGWTRSVLVGIGVVFLLRAIGDFRYIGFFRKIRDTDFARYDRALFTPFCLLLFALAAWLASY